MTEQQRETMAVIRARAGDREALESLLRRVQPDLSRYLSGVVGRQDADDVLQDVFLQIWRMCDGCARRNSFVRGLIESRAGPPSPS